VLDHGLAAFRSIDSMRKEAWGVVDAKHAPTANSSSTDERASSASDQPRSADAGASAESRRG
jgi:hypothetical protein